MTPTTPQDTHAVNAATNAADLTKAQVSAGESESAIPPRKSESGPPGDGSDRLDRLKDSSEV